MKVLVVDDEAIICQGLSGIVKASGYEEAGCASDGLEALKLIEKEHPDIVIADIRMPVCSGIELVRICNEKKYGTKFILLTGYSEFGYAHQAMQYGVKHYILKPAKEEEILKALEETSFEIDKTKKQNDRIRDLHDRLKRITPQAMEQFLSEFIQNGRCAEVDLQFFQSLFSPSDAPCRAILMKLEGTDDYVMRFALKYISMELLSPAGAYANTTVENIIVLVTEIQDLNDIFEKIEKIRQNFQTYFEESVFASVSPIGTFRDIPQLFRRAKEGFYYRFYLKPDTVMYPELIEILRSSNMGHFDFQFALSETRMMTGDEAIVYKEITDFFDAIENSRLPIPAAKSSILQFYLVLNRTLWGYDHEIDMEEISRIFRMETLADIRKYFLGSVETAQKKHSSLNSTIQNKLTQRMKDIIGANIGNPQLSLKWIAKNKLFMNEDYLSKIFRQTTSERFSHYVTRLRIDQAIKMIESDSEVKISALSNEIGFGDNTAYFCTIFKNMVGVTPTEYKKKISVNCNRKPD